MKKIAVFSDIHGNYQALDAILNDIKKYDYDEVIFLGDAIGIGPEPYKCLDRLLKSNITYIYGNHENKPKDTESELQKLEAMDKSATVSAVTPPSNNVNPNLVNNVNQTQTVVQPVNPTPSVTPNVQSTPAPSSQVQNANPVASVHPVETLEL